MQETEGGSYHIHIHDAITGGRKKDVHIKHVEPGRDFTPWLTADLRTVITGDACPLCGAQFYSKKGNELGHIFKLGYKYTKSMNVSFLDENGKSKTPIMGCYGIGVDRALASIIEENHDKNGIIWPMSVAPYHIAIVPIKYSGEMKKTADIIYNELTNAGIEVLLDDRKERPGVKFTDIDLIGIPLRIVVSPKHLPNIELKLRNNDDTQILSVTDAYQKVQKIINTTLAHLNS